MTRCRSRCMVANAGGKTLVTNAGSSGKFLGVLDLDLGKGAVKDVRYRLLPVFADLIKPDPRHGGADRAPARALRGAVRARRSRPPASCCIRRGNFTGTMDQVICDALRHELDAQIALSPGFRWGTTLLPGPADHHGGRAVGNRDHLSGGLCPGHDRRADQGGHGRHRRQSVQSPTPIISRAATWCAIGGMDYACAPDESAGNRISDMTLDDGRAARAGKTYSVAGWASVNPQSRQSRSTDVVAAYLRSARRPISIRGPIGSRSRASPTIPDYAEARMNAMMVRTRWKHTYTTTRADDPAEIDARRHPALAVRRLRRSDFSLRAAREPRRAGEKSTASCFMSIRTIRR